MKIIYYYNLRNRLRTKNEGSTFYLKPPYYAVCTGCEEFKGGIQNQVSHEILKPGGKGFHYFFQINLRASDGQKTDFFSCDQVPISVCLR